MGQSVKICVVQVSADSPSWGQGVQQVKCLHFRIQIQKATSSSSIPMFDLQPKRPQNLRESLELSANNCRHMAQTDSLKLACPVLLVVVRSQLHSSFCAGHLQPGHLRFGAHCSHCKRFQVELDWSLKGRRKSKGGLLPKTKALKAVRAYT